MFSLARIPTLFLVTLGLLSRLVVSDSDDGSDGGSQGSSINNINKKVDAAVFVYPTDAGPDFTFALRAVDDNGDLYFHMSGPSKYSWLAWGVGKEMPNALMFVMYQAEGGNGVTLSPRVAIHGESEPSYWPAITCEQTGSSSNDPSMMSVDTVCRNASTWEYGSIDLTSADQPYMFAFGPDVKLESDSLSAPMIRHVKYGNFGMDMKQATVNTSGSVPQPNASGKYVSINSSSAYGIKREVPWLGVAHGVIAVFAYVFLFPLGAALLRLSSKVPVRLHYICQTIAGILVLIGFGLGIAAAREYNRSRDYNTAHEIIGLILISFSVIQYTGGAVHHIIVKKTGYKSPIGKIHMYLGFCIIILAMINGGLGLRLARKFCFLNEDRRIRH